MPLSDVGEWQNLAYMIIRDIGPPPSEGELRTLRCISAETKRFFDAQIGAVCFVCFARSVAYVVDLHLAPIVGFEEIIHATGSHLTMNGEDPNNEGTEQMPDVPARSPRQ